VVIIISPKFRLKTPSGLGDPLIESLERFRGQFSGLSRVIRSLVPGDPKGVGLSGHFCPGDPVWLCKAQGDPVTCAG
jgi:hypothetical protein